MKSMLSRLRLPAAAGLLVFGWSGSLGAAEAPALFWQHFAGIERIAQDTNAATLKQVWDLPASSLFRQEILKHLAGAPFRALQKQLPAGAESNPDGWQPLVADLVTAETVAEVRERAGGYELTVALPLNNDRAGLWNTNLTQIARAWKLTGPTSITLADAPGWEARNPAGAGLLQIIRVRNWVVVGWGRERPAAMAEWVRQIAESGRPVPPLRERWLEARIDFPRLQGRFPAVAALELPPTRVQVSAREGFVRTAAELEYAKPLDWRPVTWRIPTNHIGEPLISFTLARGFAPLLKNLPGFGAVGFDPLPDQVCLWGQKNPHVQVCATIPVKNATNLVEKLSTALPRYVESQPALDMGQFLWVSNRNTLVWQTAPFVFPTLSPLADSGQDYLLCAFFPIPQKVVPPPPELFEQVLNRPELIYYHWELTSERLPQMNRMWQLIDIGKKRQLTSTNARSFQWILAAAPLLGNTITEVTRTAERQVTLTRKSHLGFTGFELATLARWVHSPGFPLTFEPPAPMATLTNQIPATTPKRVPKAPRGFRQK